MGFLTRFRGKLITKKKKSTDVVCVNYRISRNFDEPRSSLSNSRKLPATKITKPSPKRELPNETIPKVIPEAKPLPGGLNNYNNENSRTEKEHEYEEVDETSKSTLIFMTETHDKKSIQDESEILRSSTTRSEIETNSIYDQTESNENKTITAATPKNVRFKNRESVIEDSYYNTNSTESINEIHYNPVEETEETEDKGENNNNTEDISIQSTNTKRPIKRTREENTVFLLNNNENHTEQIMSTADANTKSPIAETTSKPQEGNTVYFLDSNEEEIDDFKINIMHHNKDDTDDEDENDEESYTQFKGTTFSNYASNIFFGEDEDTLSQGSTASA